MMFFSSREMRRQTGLPPFREYLRVARTWELVRLSCILAANLASFIVPWAVTGSYVAAVFGFIGYNVLVMIVSVAWAIAEIRRPEPRRPHGTYWDGKAWQYAE